MEQALKRLKKRLLMDDEAVILIRSSDEHHPMLLKDFYTAARSVFPLGTLVVLDEFVDELQEIENEKEREVLASGKLLQLMKLNDQAREISHPALLGASLGKYAGFLARERPLDFPYADASLFEDLYDLGAYVFFIGANHQLIESRYAFKDHPKKTIFKRTVKKEGQEFSYLDYDFPLDSVHSIIFSKSKISYEIVGETAIYAISYGDYIKDIRDYFWK